MGLEKRMGKAYCELRHPVETSTTNRTGCEQQHILQRQEGGGHDNNIIWINTTEHDYLDRSRDRPWERIIHEPEDRPWWCFIGRLLDWIFGWMFGWLIPDDNMKQAFKMGMYANGYHFMVYDYRRDEGQMTLIEWDGASHLLYGVASVANFITKELSYVGYQFEADNSQFADAFLGILIDLGELLFGLCYTFLGVIVGTILNPWDTLTNLIAMFGYGVLSIVLGAWNTAADVLSLVTFGYVQLQWPPDS